MVKRFSIQRKEIPIEMEVNDKGDAQTLILRELDGPGRDEYVNLIGAKVKLDKKGQPVGMTDHTGLPSKLVSMSLFDITGKPIPEEIVKAWPASVISELFKMALELSGLGPKAEEEAKND